MIVERDSSPDNGDAEVDGVQISHTDGAEKPADATGSAANRGRARRILARWRAIVATTVVLAAVAAAVGVYLVVYRPDQRVDDAAAHRVIQAASEGATAVLSYSYDHLNRDFATAKSRLTGDFLAYYTKFTDAVVAPTAQQGQLTATAKVIRSAISELHPDSAVVLVFVDQTTVSIQKKDPDKNASAVVVTLTKVDGSWLISKFEPVG
jgi:Mce-associated membrane protein